MTNAVKRLKRQNAEKRERWKRANSNPLIWFPVRLLAARGSLVVSANSNIVVPTGKGYNIRSSKGLPGILKVCDWINEAYQLCFDILEDPWQVAYDELLAADEEEIFLNWPNGMNNLGEEYQRWKIEQVRNRPPKVTDTPQLQIATFFVCLLKDEDLFLLSPDEISLFSKRFRITKLLQEQWRYTISKLLDFAVEQGTKPNAANDTESLLKQVLKNITDNHNEGMKALEHIKDYAEIAATRRYNQLKKQSGAGRRAAKLAKTTTWTDPRRERAITEAKDRIEKGEKPAAVYADLAGCWTTPQGKPVSADGVKQAVQRSRQEKRGNRKQAGKKRGRYRTIGHSKR